VSITLSAGSDASNDIQIGNLTDLQNSASTLFKLADSIIGYLNQPVSSFPSADSPVTLNYQSGNISWTLGNFTFGLSGGVSGSISILQPGQTILTFTKTFPTTIGTGLDTDTSTAATGTITVPDGQFYVGVELDLTLAANAAANVQIGSIGIQGSAGTSDTFAVRFYKNVAGGTLLKDALAAAFEGFVLPLHSQTYQHLQPGDYINHQFNATLALGFGATLGLDKVYFSGQYEADIPGAPAAPSVNASVTAEVKAGATFGATFNLTGSYEALLWKADANTGRLHLYRNKTTDVNFNFGATVTVIADPTVTLSSGNLQTLVNQVLPGGTGAVVNQLLTGPAQSQVNTWVSEAQAKINSWLQPFQQGQTQLQVAIDNTQSSFLLVAASFDLTALGFTTAWSTVIAGDFNGALALPTGGVSLDAGSGLENFHTKTTSVTFNLFGLFRAEWDTSTIDNYSILYAGNNTFHLIERIGDRQTSVLNGRGREIDLYFAAEATSTPAGLTLGEIDLYVQLKATANGGFGKLIAGFFSKATTGEAATQITKQLLATAQQSNATEILELLFKPSAYGRLTSSTLNGNRPIINEPADEANYGSFAAACSQFESSPPANFSISNPMDLDYPTWRTCNIIANNGSVSPNSVPSRINIGNPTAAAPFLNQRFNSSIPAALISFTLDAAGSFMNLCEALKNLAALIESSNASWNELRSNLQNIIQNDVPSDFLIPTAYALSTSLGQVGVQPLMSGPAPVAPEEPTITVTLVYS